MGDYTDDTIHASIAILFWILARQNQVVSGREKPILR